MSEDKERQIEMLQNTFEGIKRDIESGEIKITSWNLERPSVEVYSGGDFGRKFKKGKFSTLTIEIEHKD